MTKRLVLLAGLAIALLAAEALVRWADCRHEPLELKAELEQKTRTDLERMLGRPKKVEKLHLEQGKGQPGIYASVHKVFPVDAPSSDGVEIQVLHWEDKYLAINLRSQSADTFAIGPVVTMAFLRWNGAEWIAFTALRWRPAEVAF